MANYCKDCGEKIEEKFQFCPFCGKKLIKPKICSNCGYKLKDTHQFCPECGTKCESSDKKTILPSKKDNKNDEKEKIEDEKPVKKPKTLKKPKKPYFSISFFKNFKKSKKMILILSIIIIVIIAAAALLILNPFNPNNNTSGITFSISVQNDYGDDIQYYLIFDGYYHIGDINNPFDLINGDSTNPITVNENDLTIKKNTHSVTLFVSIDETSWDSGIASITSESVDFLVSNLDGAVNITYTV